jgi:hypothetical protein
MGTRSQCYPSMNESRANGSELVAACGPLQVIAAKLLARHRDSRRAVQQVCALLATSKDFLQALQGCGYLLPVKYGPPATEDTAAAFAGETSACCACSTACSSSSRSVHDACSIVSGKPANGVNASTGSIAWLPRRRQCHALACYVCWILYLHMWYQVSTERLTKT